MSVGKEVEKLELLYTFGRHKIYKRVSLYGKQYSFFKKLKLDLPGDHISK